MVMLQDCKTEECQNKLQQLQFKEQGKEHDHVKDGETSLMAIEIQEDSLTRVPKLLSISLQVCLDVKGDIFSID
jgi:hypothetical protein